MFFLQQFSLKQLNLSKRVIIFLKLLYVVFFLHVPLIILILLNYRKQIYSIIINQKIRSTFSLASSHIVRSSLSESVLEKKDDAKIGKTDEIPSVNKLAQQVDTKKTTMLTNTNDQNASMPKQPASKAIKKLAHNSVPGHSIAKTENAQKKLEKKEIIKKIENEPLFSANLTSSQYQEVKNLVASYWHPPAGMASCRTTVMLSFSKSGQIMQTKFTKTSAALFDISIEMALREIKFPQWAFGKKIEIIFEIN